MRLGRHLNPSAPNWLRLGATVFAAVLGVSAVWMLTVELIRPALPFFPEDVATARAAAAHRGAAGAAAWSGLIRGDLWTDYAMTLAPDLSGKPTGDAAAASLQALEGTRSSAMRGAELAPYDARAWLLLAGVDSRGLDHKAAGPLKMSYYTAPDAVSLIPLRINIATRTDAITDPDLQILVGGEIRTIITHKPDLKPAIVYAYRNAGPDGRRFIEAEVGELDPDLIASLRAMDPSR
jgi:hypothetical protein